MEHETSLVSRSLANLNAAPRRWTWSNTYVLETRYAVGKVGPSWKQGAKIHLVRQDVVVDYADGFEPKPNQYKIGGVFSAHAPCNSNGQHTGRAVDAWDTDKITCRSCLKAVQS